MRLCVLVCISAVCLSAMSCTHSAGAEKSAAIQAASGYAVTLSRRLLDQIPLDEDKLVVTEASRESEGGWMVYLNQGSCRYIVYAWPGHNVDVTSISEGCNRSHAEASDIRPRSTQHRR